jgi:nitrogen regulatory protein PII
MYMILFVLDDPEQLDQVLDAWDSVGVTGVTIVESTGINRRRQASQVGAPFMAGINRLMSGDIENHFTLFCIVRSESLVDQCVKATEGIVGDLDEPNSGVLVAWPLTFVKGVPVQAPEDEAS